MLRNMGRGYYVVEVEGERLIALGQGYDAGWIAYAINRNDQLSTTNDQTKCEYSNYRCIKRIAPWWFGERLEKVKLNGWANAWIVPSLDGEPSFAGASEGRGGWSNGFVLSDKAPSNSHTLDVPDALLRGREAVVVIVYWPQYLQWVGFLGLGVVVIWLVGGGIRGRFFGPKTS
jgi:hypothetical protein